MANCPSCGAPIDAHLDKCPYCGATIEFPKSAQATAHRGIRNSDFAEDELDNMSRSELLQIIEDRNLDIKVMKSWSDDEIRDAIRLEQATVAIIDDKENEGSSSKGFLLNLLWLLIGLIALLAFIL